jgi:hypothetical protein
MCVQLSRFGFDGKKIGGDALANQRYVGEEAKNRFFLKYKRLSNNNGFVAALNTHSSENHSSISPR